MKQIKLNVMRNTLEGIKEALEALYFDTGMGLDTLVSDTLYDIIDTDEPIDMMEGYFINENI